MTEPSMQRPDAPAACRHERVSRVSPLYVDGRPLYKCDDCGGRFTYEDDEPSFKALAKTTATVVPAIGVVNGR